MPAEGSVNQSQQRRGNHHRRKQRDRIRVADGAGHLIENNRLDYNLRWGVSADWASNSVIRGHRIYDTGGIPSNLYISAINIRAGDAIDVRDNVIAGVFGAAAGTIPSSESTASLSPTSLTLAHGLKKHDIVLVASGTGL